MTREANAKKESHECNNEDESETRVFMSGASKQCSVSIFESSKRTLSNVTRSAACSNDSPEISSTILFKTGSLLVAAGGGGGVEEVDAATSVASARTPYPP